MLICLLPTNLCISCNFKVSLTLYISPLNCLAISTELDTKQFRKFLMFLRNTFSAIFFKNECWPPSWILGPSVQNIGLIEKFPILMFRVIEFSTGLKKEFLNLDHFLIFGRHLGFWALGPKILVLEKSFSF